MDGRLFKRTDEIVRIQFTKDGYAKFGNSNNCTRLCDPKGNIIIDFDEQILFEDLDITDDKIYSIDANCHFKIRDLKGETVYEQDKVSSFELSKFAIILTCLCEDNIDRVMAITDEGDVLSDLDCNLAKCRISNYGVIFCQDINGKTSIKYGEKEFDYGYKCVHSVSFANDVMLITGSDFKNKISTLIVKKLTPIDCLKGNIEAIMGFNGELLLKVVEGKKTEYYLYNKEGKLIEHFGHKQGEINLEEMGALCVNKKGYCRFILPDGSYLYDYNEKRASVICLNENFYASSARQYPKTLRNVSSANGDFDVEIVDALNKIPKFYLKDVCSVHRYGNFIWFYKSWIQESQVIGGDKEWYLHRVVCNGLVVFSKDGKFITNRIQPKELDAVSVYDCDNHCIAFKNEDGNLIYFDVNGNQYNEKVILGPNGEIYAVENDHLVTRKLPTMSSDEIKSYQEHSKGKELKYC